MGDGIIMHVRWTFYSKTQITLGLKGGNNTTQKAAQVLVAWPADQATESCLCHTWAPGPGCRDVRGRPCLTCLCTFPHLPGPRLSDDESRNKNL